MVIIADDGPGMEEDVLKRIRALEPVEKKDGTHIGIWNCAYRLRTLCGEGAGVTVESVLSEGTAVHIHIPAEAYANQCITSRGLHK